MGRLCTTGIMFLLSGSIFAQDLVKKCMPASFAHAKTAARESFTDEFGNYFEFKGVQYGTSLQGEGYVGVDSKHVMLTAIHFRDPKGKSVALQADDLALSRAIAYGSKSDHSVICVLSPFSGVGSSGSFQGVAGLIAIRKPHGQSPLRTEGALFGRNSGVQHGAGHEVVRHEPTNTDCSLAFA